MKHFVIIYLIMAVFCAGIFSHSMMNAKAAEAARPQTTRYYTGIYIQEGDNLWSIASRFKHNSSMSTSEYIDELKRMNGLHDDTIHAGQYLTIVYFE